MEKKIPNVDIISNNGNSYNLRGFKLAKSAQIVLSNHQQPITNNQKHDPNKSIKQGRPRIFSQCC